MSCRQCLAYLLKPFAARQKRVRRGAHTSHFCAVRWVHRSYFGVRAGPYRCLQHKFRIAAASVLSAALALRRGLPVHGGPAIARRYARNVRRLYSNRNGAVARVTFARLFRVPFQGCMLSWPASSRCFPARRWHYMLASSRINLPLYTGLHGWRVLYRQPRLKTICLCHSASSTQLAIQHCTRHGPIGKMARSKHAANAQRPAGAVRLRTQP